MKSIIFLFLIISLQVHGQQKGKLTFVCPPCTTNCDNELYNAPGICPVCKMTLVEQSAISGEIVEKVYPLNQLQEDFAYFRSALEEEHPALYWHTSKDTMDKAFQQAYALVNHAMNEMDFFRVLMPVVTKIGCSHTFMPFPAEIALATSKKGKFFPLNLIFLHGKAYTTGDYESIPGIPKGSEILSINNKKMSQIIAHLFNYITTDNNTSTYKYRHLDINFADFYHSFVEAPDSFVVELKYNQKASTAKVSALSKQAMEARNQELAKQLDKGKSSHSEREDKILSFKQYSNTSTAVLTIKNFQDHLMQVKGQHFTTFVDSIFTKIEKDKISNLIIDIRGNTGGSTGNSSYLYAYLTEKPFKVDAYMEVKTLPLKYITFSGILDSNGKPILLKESDFTKTDQGRFRLKSYPSLETVKPQKKPFKGKVIVLIDGYVSSEGSSLAYLLHQSKRATFIGEETGGNYNGCSAGILGNTYLPHTKLRVTIPAFQIVRATTDPDFESRGIIPHYPLEPTIEDIIKGKDVILEQAFGLLKK